MRRGVYSYQSIQHALRAMPELRSGLLLLSAWPHVRLELKTADAPTTGNGPDPTAAKESSSACHLSGPSRLLSAGMLLCIPPDGSMLRVRLRAHPMPGKKESDPRWLVAGESNLSAEDYPPLQGPSGCPLHPFRWPSLAADHPCSKASPGAAGLRMAAQPAPRHSVPKG